METKKFQINYEGDLRVKMEHLGSGTIIYSDAPLDNNGKGEAFSPTDLLVASLVSCILTITGIHYEKKGIKLKPINCEVNKIMYSDPRRVGEIHIEFDFTSNTFVEKDYQIISQIIHSCPVTASLSNEVKIVTNLPG
jgi:putative redox protein